MILPFSKHEFQGQPGRRKGMKKIMGKKKKNK
jgi:hypothetical protein